MTWKRFSQKAKLVIDCNAYPARAVRREENGVYTCQQWDYKKLDNKEYQAVVLDVFSVERTKMLKSVVPLVQQTLMHGNDVIFHDKYAVRLCVIAGAAIQRSLTGQQLYVSDCKFCWVVLAVQSQN